MILTDYQVLSKKLKSTLKIAVLADLHNGFSYEILKEVKKANVDLILIPGDLTDDKTLQNGNSDPFDFLRDCVSIAPTFYSLGNHEIACYHKGNPFAHPRAKTLPHACLTEIRKTGAVLLDNESVLWNGIHICGLTSGLNGRVNAPDPNALDRFSELDGVKILLCHHPEYYYPYLRRGNFDLVVSGHAHGGHWRLFGKAIYAPGQGIFPKYADGILDGVCVISRGLGDHTKIPRIHNPHELVFITLQPEK